MKRKVKKGSSLLYVVILTAMLITFGTVVLILTVTDYKMRISEGNRIKNLYSAESGIEEAYGKLSKLLYIAVENGQKAVKESEDKDKEKENFKKAYKDTVEKNIKETLESEYISKNGSRPNLIVVTPDESLKFKDDKMSVVVQASFVDKNSLSKTIQSTFNIAIPEYEGITSSSISTIPIKPAWSKAIVAEKNMLLKGPVVLDGGAYIGGKAEGNEKGLIVTSRGKADVTNGDIITLEDIRLKGIDSNFKVDKSNVFTDSLVIEKSTSEAHIDIKGKVYANNDLALNANKSSINIEGGFYGINDETELGTFEEDSKKSSSIYVNNDDLGENNGSYINIKNEALIMGTAYIKTNPHYQTGESVAIKGNYRIYAETLNMGPLSGENILFKYKDPMQLADAFKDGNLLNYEDKSAYIKQYIEENPKDIRIKYGEGITLPANTINVGGIFTNGEFKPSNYIVDNEGGIVKEAKTFYENAVDSVNLDSDIKFENIKFEAIQLGGEVLYLDNSSKLTYILGNGGERVSGEGYEIDASHPIKGVVITSGDVIVRGKVNFTGTIITKGNIIFEDNKSKVIKYDRDYVQSIIGAKFDLFKDVLSSSPDSVVLKPGNTTSLVNAVDMKSLISIKKWKIIK
ncbi:MAG: hypothetical protein E6X21_05050 [Clostridium sp.]|uniref:hypothetical protein n=1 Tax=Clostridium sp. TaxID=1506 RepID=UPI00290646A4|nr:hypothetical protein [Clostridium sp.]